MTEHKPLSWDDIKYSEDYINNNIGRVLELNKVSDAVEWVAHMIRKQDDLTDEQEQRINRIIYQGFGLLNEKGEWLGGKK